MEEEPDFYTPSAPHMQGQALEEKNLTNVRVFHLLNWQWTENRCAVRLSSDNPNTDLTDILTGPLPPFASISFLYTGVTVVGNRITDWLALPCILDSAKLKASMTLRNSSKLTELRNHLGLPRADADALFQKGIADEKIQILDFMDPTCKGVFDGLNLTPREVQILSNNYKHFGRHEKRYLHSKHEYVLPLHSDPIQSGNFSRSSIPQLKELSKASRAWMQCRQGAAAGISFTEEDIELAYGREIADMLSGRLPLPVPLYPTIRVSKDDIVCERFLAGDMHVIGPEDKPARISCLDFDNDQGIFWFAANAAAADMNTKHGVPAVGVHEREGVGMSLAMTESDYTFTNGKLASKGGFRRLQQVPVFEGGDTLFSEKTLSRIGFLASNQFSWTPELVQRVLRLAEEECEFYTNCILFKINMLGYLD